MRYRIEVRAQRGDQPSYTYVVYDRVKPAKAQRLLDKAIMDIAKHERAWDFGRPTFTWHAEDPDGYACATLVAGIATFTTTITPIYKGNTDV
jgi:hypothetical protein